MPKMKTSRSAAKRFKITSKGRVRCQKAYHRHILTKKSSNRKRKLRKTTVLHKVDEKRIKKLLPYN